MSVYVCISTNCYHRYPVQSQQPWIRCDRLTRWIAARNWFACCRTISTKLWFDPNFSASETPIREYTRYVFSIALPHAPLFSLPLILPRPNLRISEPMLFVAEIIALEPHLSARVCLPLAILSPLWAFQPLVLCMHASIFDDVIFP